MTDCVADCKSRNFTYAGVQDGGQCFCDDSFGKYGKVPESDCYKACQSDASQICGGPWANGVYETGNLKKNRALKVANIVRVRLVFSL